MQKLYRDAANIIKHSIEQNLPDAAVRSTLKNRLFSGDIYLVAIGKAAWPMAKAARQELCGKIKKGIVLTKYGHSFGCLPNTEIIEAGHPLPDENSIIGTEKILSLCAQLKADDTLLLLLSGGGSALFEKPLPGLELSEIIEVNMQLLATGASITEINTIRKRLSSVKGGRFAQFCAPARIFSIALSDVLSDRLDIIASGPAAPDPDTAEDALVIAEKYSLRLTKKALQCLSLETPKMLDNVQTVISGSVRHLCQSAARAAAKLGYTPHILTTSLDCEARAAGQLLAALAHDIEKNFHGFQPPCALILGGETVVKIHGSGKGGRCQELALAAAQGIDGLDDVLIFAFGSDGTDGPTDAAGGMVDGKTATKLRENGLIIQHMLDDNNSYHALKTADALIITGPTGTNVNDLAVVLHR